MITVVVYKKKKMAPKGSGAIRLCDRVGVRKRKYVTVEVGFEGSYMLKSHSVRQFTSGCLQDVYLSTPSTMSACMPRCPTMMIMD